MILLIFNFYNMRHLFVKHFVCLLLLLSLWGKIAAQQNFIDVYQANPGKITTRVYKTIDATSLTLKFYYPQNFKSQNKYPAIVFFFGGGWISRKIKQFEPHAQYFASRGMIGIVADYRTRNAQGTTPFDAVKDAKSAIRYLRENAKELHIKDDQIVASGGSSGGHLAAATAILDGLNDSTDNLKISDKPNALVLFNPVFDNGPNGYGYKRIDKRFKEISPMHNIQKGVPPTIVFLGSNDRLIPVNTAELYKAKMDSVGSRCDLHIYQDQKHGFFNYRHTEYFNKTVTASDHFLVSLGILKKQKKK